MPDLIGRRLRIAAALVSVLYILIQSFQFWVFWKVPEGNSGVQAFLSGHHPLNIARSTLMLLAIFGLLFIYFTVCFSFYLQNKAGAILAFLGFFVFFLLEIMLRSTELFYFQIQLPAVYRGTMDAALQGEMLRSFAAFQGIQHALYFPLMFAPTIGSVILLAIIPRLRVHSPILAAFGINTVRVLVRILGEYLGWNILGENFTNWSYLPLVYIIFGLTAYWLVTVDRKGEVLAECLEGRIPQSSTSPSR